MAKAYKVQVCKEYFIFSAGHFITYDGHKCESLHGHNYRVLVCIEGDLDENWYVVDFGVLKKTVRELTEELDHKVMLPLDNPLIKLEKTESSITARYKDRIYMLPVQDVVLLPIPNTTVEMIAEYLCGRIRIELGTIVKTKLHAFEVEVEECVGQSAIYRETMEDV